MTEEQRTERISRIMGYVRGLGYEEDVNIPIGLWLKAEDNPNNKEWISICKQMVSWAETFYKRKDNDSIFSICLRKYNKRKKRKDE